MNSPQSLEQLLQKLQVPAQTLNQLSFCENSRDGSSKWIQSLPLTQIQFVSGLLYKALPEISRLQTSVSNRINLLEAVRVPSAQIIEGLAKSFLNQPLILPEETIKTATIVQALQKHLNTGYVVAVRDLCRELSPKRHLLTLSLHRAILGMGLLLCRYYQLYLPVPEKLWSDLHNLYQIAAHFGVLEEPVAETLPQPQNCNTINLAYMRVLLLACSRPNQLRQTEIIATYDALNTLTSLAQLTRDNGNNTAENLFCVALDSSQAPNYRSRIVDMGYSFLLVLNTKNVVKKLQMLDQNTNDDTENNSRPSGSGLTHALIQHLLQAWNALSLRSLDRQPTAGTLDVTVGISSIHYHLAGRTDFAEFLDDQHRQPSSGPLGSLFNNRNLPISELTRTSPGSTKPTASLYELDELDELDSPAAPMVEAKKINELYPIYQVPLIDTSPGGYCIEWRDEIPSQVKAGELLGLLDPVRNYWSLGVVRWANLTQGATQLGIQILAPQAIPVAIALVQNSGDCSEFLRALEIPPISALGQPATLITNTISFREQSKARIYHRAQDSETQSADENIQLNRRCFATGAFNQFTYQNLAPTAPKVSEKSTLFDPEWDA